MIIKIINGEAKMEWENQAVDMPKTLQTKSKADYSRPSPSQTIADQSILRSAVLPASPMPLFHLKVGPFCNSFEFCDGCCKPET